MLVSELLKSEMNQYIRLIEMINHYMPTYVVFYQFHGTFKIDVEFWMYSVHTDD